MFLNRNVASLLSRSISVETFASVTVVFAGNLMVLHQSFFFELGSFFFSMIIAPVIWAENYGRCVFLSGVILWRFIWRNIRDCPTLLNINAKEITLKMMSNFGRKLF